MRILWLNFTSNFVVALLLLLPVASVCGEDWQAGVARIAITPEEPMWLSGYASRNKPAEGKLTDLWAKSLVLKDAQGKVGVLLTLDLVGIDRELSSTVCQRLEKEHGLPRSAIAIVVSHTHSGPVVGNNLEPTYVLDDEQQQRVKTYTAGLADKLVEVVGKAFDDLKPARLGWSTGAATFAVNRRNNPEDQVVARREEGRLVGPVDHDVPVLAVFGSDNALRAIAFGYACHATVLSDYVWCGDWPGFAQIELEKRHPEAVALFWAGCGADQNPLPRRTVELAKNYGRQIADAVDAVLDAPLTSLAPRLATKYEEIPLAFGELPSREQLEQEATGNDYAARRARLLLDEWQRNGELRASYPYPVQVWRLGDELDWVFLGGEVVVDYSIRLKRQLQPRRAWIAGYSNDVMAYIPSERVLQEGGYEGGGAMVYYGLPAPWATGVEDHIVEKCLELAR